jgi:hypothetical protein
MLSATSTAFATEDTAIATLEGNNTVIFSNLSYLDVNESIEFDVVDANGNAAVVGIERVPSTIMATTATTNSWKIWYTGVTINAHFYMNVSSNVVTSVYDSWILTIGSSFSNDVLTKTSTYGKLSFTVNGYANLYAGTCWLKGTTTGSNNDVSVTWSM